MYCIYVETESPDRPVHFPVMYFGHPLYVTCVSDVELLGKNIPCKSSILLYFHRLGESCYFIIEIRIPAVCLCYNSLGLEKKKICRSS